MKRLKRYSIFPFYTLVLAALLAISPANVGAATEYDDYVQTVSQMIFKPKSHSTTELDMTARWGEIASTYLNNAIASSGDPGRVAMATTALGNLQSGAGYLVVYSGGNFSTIEIVFFDPGATLSFGYKWSTSSANFQRVAINNTDYLYNLNLDKYHAQTNPTEEDYISGILSRADIYDYISYANSDDTINNPLVYYRSNFIRPFEKFFLIASSNVTYPSGYEGPIITDGSSIDADEDGLSLVQEVQQGTSDSSADTDGDGISDLKESIWYADRDEVFCNTSDTPYICAYPDALVRDIYVEIDWMQNSSRNFRPNSTQVYWASLGLGDYGYNVHIDTGEYGGGNALPYITDMPFMPDAVSTNYFDLKDGDPTNSTPANFDPKRKGVWRYLISGYNYDENPESSGAAFAGSENTFISYGMIEDGQTQYGYTDLNVAIAGTIVHELGHSLCLSSDERQMYSYQSATCQFSGIDSWEATSAYDSVMNYNLQMLIVHLSYGDNGSGDHDDWGAIDDGGIADFSNWTIGEIGLGASPGKILPGITKTQAAEAQRSGTLGKVKRGDEVYDYREKAARNIKTGRVSSFDTTPSQRLKR